MNIKKDEHRHNRVESINGEITIFLKKESRKTDTMNWILAYEYGLGKISKVDHSLNCFKNSHEKCCAYGIENCPEESKWYLKNKMINTFNKK